MWRKSGILSAVIGSGLDCSDALNASSMSPKSILLSSCFSIAVLLTKAAPVIRSPNNTAIKLCAKAPAAWRCSRDPSRRVGDKYDLDQRRGAVAMNDSKSSRRSTMLRLTFDIPDDALERAASVEQNAFPTMMYCTNDWYNCGLPQ